MHDRLIVEKIDNQIALLQKQIDLKNNEYNEMLKRYSSIILEIEDYKGNKR